MKEIHIFVSGDVQGVGFRAAVKRHSEEIGLKGFVRNLEDGRVEICAQGTEKQIEALLDSLESKPGRGRVSSIGTKFESPKRLFPNFEIIY